MGEAQRYASLTIREQGGVGKNRKKRKRNDYEDRGDGGIDEEMGGGGRGAKKGNDARKGGKRGKKQRQR